MDFLIKYKKVFLAIGFVIIIVILGYLLYWAFFKPISPPAISQPPATTTPQGLPLAPTGKGQVVGPSQPAGLPAEIGEIKKVTPSEVAQGGLTQTKQLNQLPTLAATLSADGSDLQFYNQNDGKFYRLTKDGKTSELSNKIFHQVEKIVWSPNKEQAILEYPDGSNIVYNFTSQQQITLPSHWKDFAYAADGSKLVLKSLGLDPDNRWLAITNNDGSQAQRLEALGEKDETVYPAWSPNNQVVAMYTESLDFDRQEVFFVGLYHENFKSTIIEGRGFQPKWSPTGEQLLYSVYSSKNDLKPMLWLVNAQGEAIGSGRRSLNIETWADKCAFASQTELYCAVPEKLEAGAGLFPEMAKATKDNLYKIDLQTGLKKLIASPAGSYNMSDLIISQNGYYLYFTDKNTQTLQQIKLK